MSHSGRQGSSRPTPTCHIDAAAPNPIAFPSANASTVTSIAPTNPNDLIDQWIRSAIIAKPHQIDSQQHVGFCIHAHQAIHRDRREEDGDDADHENRHTGGVRVGEEHDDEIAARLIRSKAPNGKNTMASFRTVSCHRSITCDSRPSWMAVVMPTIMTLQTVVATRSTTGICRHPTE